jgi:lipoprotein-anchoring transpeptidase ErfK/SrfK
MKPVKFTRRTLFRLAGLAAPTFFLRTPSPSFAAGEPVASKTRRPFARAITAGVPVREQPAVNSRLVRNLKWDEVVAVSGQAASDASPSSYNKIWYRTTDGWVHSRFMQPVENLPQPVAPTVPAEGLWAETAVASMYVRVKADPQAGVAFHVPFGTNFQVLQVVEGADARPWYRISDGRSDRLYVQAESLRRLGVEDFAPISPAVPLERKRIDVDLRRQEVIAYEDEREVFRARCATGAQFKMEDGSIVDMSTTRGDHWIYQKTPSRRMTGGTRGQADFYDLPGIPWVAYFTASRIAFHGAYWHNDFGARRSHGCVNLLPEDAQWVYRWTLPRAPYEERWTTTTRRDEGSLVRVF